MLGEGGILSVPLSLAHMGARLFRELNDTELALGNLPPDPMTSESYGSSHAEEDSVRSGLLHRLRGGALRKCYP